MPCSCSRLLTPLDSENILPVFFPRLVHHPQSELERIGRFLNHDGPLVWDTALKPQNMGKERLRRSPIRQALVQAPVLSTLRQRIVPRNWSESLKEFWRAQIEPPALQPDLIAQPARRLRRRSGPARLVAGDHARLRDISRHDHRATARLGHRLTARRIQGLMPPRHPGDHSLPAADAWRNVNTVDDLGTDELLA